MNGTVGIFACYIKSPHRLRVLLLSNLHHPRACRIVSRSGHIKKYVTVGQQLSRATPRRVRGVVGPSESRGSGGLIDLENSRTAIARGRPAEPQMLPFESSTRLSPLSKTSTWISPAVLGLTMVA